MTGRYDMVVGKAIKDRVPLFINQVSTIYIFLTYVTPSQGDCDLPNEKRCYRVNKHTPFTYLHFFLFTLHYTHTSTRQVKLQIH